MELRDRHKQTEISLLETIEGHGRWSSDKGSVFLSMPRWRPDEDPWFLSISESAKEETIGVHGRWRFETGCS